MTYTDAYKSSPDVYPTTSEPIGQVRSEGQALEKRLHELGELTARLKAKLAPILLPANEVSGSEQRSNPEPNRSEYAQQIRFANSLVEGVSENLRDILQRLDL